MIIRTTFAFILMSALAWGTLVGCRWLDEVPTRSREKSSTLVKGKPHQKTQTLVGVEKRTEGNTTVFIDEKGTRVAGENAQRTHGKTIRPVLDRTDDVFGMRVHPVAPRTK